MPVNSVVERHCVVCYKQGRGQLKVFSFRSGPQCNGKHMHVTKDKNCFRNFIARSITILDHSCLCCICCVITICFICSVNYMFDLLCLL